MSLLEELCNPNAMDEYKQGKQRITLVVYDIVDNKRRYRVHKALKAFGIRVQKSAFECLIDDSQHNKLIKRIAALINEKEDLLRIYRLPAIYDVFCVGEFGRLEDEQDFWIV